MNTFLTNNVQITVKMNTARHACIRHISFTQSNEGGDKRGWVGMFYTKKNLIKTWKKYVNRTMAIFVQMVIFAV